MIHKDSIIVLSARSQPQTLFTLLPNEVIKAKGSNIIYINVLKLFPEINQNFNIIKLYQDQVNYLQANSIDELNYIINTYRIRISFSILIGWPFNDDIILTKLLKDSAVLTVKFNLLPINKPNAIKGFFTPLKLLLKKNVYPDIVVAESQHKMKVLKSQGYKNIWIIHSHIFELFYQRKYLVHKMGNQDYILYIDQNFMEHPDFKMFNIPTNNFTPYYSNVVELLRKVAQQYNTKVKIALHPSSSEETYRPIFRDMEIVKNKTYELIENAKFIIGHYSGVMDYAMLHKKNMVSIKIPQNYSQTVSNNQKIYCNKTNIKSISTQIRNIDFFNNTKRRYNKYVNRFIKSKDSPYKSFSEIFFNKINQYKID